MEQTEDTVFSPVAVDHATHPRHFGPLDVYDGHAQMTGECGDTMGIWLKVRDDRLREVTFLTDGCGPSIASGSMIVTLAKDKRVEEAAVLRQQDVLDALGGLPAEVQHCAALASDTLRAACDDYWMRLEKTAAKNVSASHHEHDENDPAFQERKKLRYRLDLIQHKIVVLSGKGGVGKSTVAMNLATALMLSGKRVGLLDADIHGPSIPTMLGLESETTATGVDGLLPVEMGGLKVMSLGFLVRNQTNAAIWRGSMKMGVIKQFLMDVDWGDLDYLIIDCPPGTGDEPLSICQMIEDLDGAIIVTTPQKVAAMDVRKSITFCMQLGVPVLGVVENMSGFVCPKCGEVTEILPTGEGRRMIAAMKVPFLGAIPMDPKIAESGDSGRVFIHQYAATPTAALMRKLIHPIAPLDDAGQAAEKTERRTSL